MVLYGGGMHGSHDQLNINQQVIAYCLIWGLDIDIGNIIFSDLVAKLLNGKKAASFKTLLASEVALTFHMLKVAKLLTEPKETLIHSSERVNADDTTDKSLSGTSVQPVNWSKAPTNKKSRKKKNPSSSQPKTLKIIRESSPLKQVTDTQHVEEPVATADTTRSVDAFESAKVLGNRPKPVDAAKDQQHPAHEGQTSECLNFTQPQGNDEKRSADESPFDTESEIKFIKKEVPKSTNDNDYGIGSVHQTMHNDDAQITLIVSSRDTKIQEADSDLESMPDDEIESISGYDNRKFSRVLQKSSRSAYWHDS
ncbi:hypothetical protein Tco_0570367 [Tanacetum coccineum]